MEGQCYDIKGGLKGIWNGYVELYYVAGNRDRWLLWTAQWANINFSVVACAHRVIKGRNMDTLYVESKGQEALYPL